MYSNYHHQIRHLDTCSHILLLFKNSQGSVTSFQHLGIKVQSSCNELHSRHLAFSQQQFEVAASCLHRRCIMTGPFLTGLFISNASRPMGLSFNECYSVTMLQLVSISPGTMAGTTRCQVFLLLCALSPLLVVSKGLHSQVCYWWYYLPLCISMHAKIKIVDLLHSVLLKMNGNSEWHYW